MFPICTGRLDMADTTGRTVFATALGFVGLGFGPSGLTRLVLPGRSRDAVARRLLGSPQAATAIADDAEGAPAFVAALVRAIRAYMEGGCVDFRDVPVDLGGIEPFRRDIYAAARQLSFGETTSYGELARRAGHPGLARETGAALGANPVPLVIPCHRVLAAGSRIGGFSAPGGAATKERMLAMEGVRLGPPPPAQQSFPF
jgi:methylated-DNA-[protein]-cysteine S-methyltransferase